MLSAGTALERLYELIRFLRGPNGCPWDRQQTHDSLRRYLLEETYETLAAISEAGNKPDKLREELGDLLLQVLLHSLIADERGAFNLEDVMVTLEKKLIRRHPHVFGSVKAASVAEVADTWAAVKAAEAAADDRPPAADGGLMAELRAVADDLPPMVRGVQLQQAAAEIGFDWDNPLAALEKLHEEIGELEAALQAADAAAVREEAGDLLFSILNVIRLAGEQPEDVLAASNEKFVARLAAMAKQAEAAGLKLEDLSVEQLEQLWQRTKSGTKLPENPN